MSGSRRTSKLSLSPSRDSDSDLTCPRFPFDRPGDIEPALEYAELRKNDPVSQVKLWDGSCPFLIVRHEDITKVLSDERLSKDRRRPGFPERSPGGKEAAKSTPTFVDMDPPRHGIYRAMVQPAFEKARVEVMECQIRKTVEDVLDAMIVASGQKPVDLMKYFAMPVPSYIIYGILGVPVEDLEFLTYQNTYLTYTPARYNN